MAHERILVVDDEAAVRSIVTALLEYSGYGVASAGSPSEALEILQQDPTYELVLSDVMMPGEDGFSLLDRMGSDFPTIPMVLFTAVHDIHVATNAFRRGAIDYLLKPFERAQLVSVVSRAIDHGKVRKQNATYRENLEAIVSARTGRLRSTMSDLERSYDFTLEAMGDALDLRDAETEGHSRRVTAYTLVLARAMGLDVEQLRTIARGAFLHDIGKIATPDHILLKRGKLDSEEVTIMRQHCTRGYEIVCKIPFLREASEIVYAHQESFDGTGYPRGLRGLKSRWVRASSRLPIPWTRSPLTGRTGKDRASPRLRRKYSSVRAGSSIRPSWRCFLRFQPSSGQSCAGKSPPYPRASFHIFAAHQLSRPLAPAPVLSLPWLPCCV